MTCLHLLGAKQRIGIELLLRRTLQPLEFTWADEDRRKHLSRCNN